MKKQSLFLVLLFLIFNTNAQEFYISAGKNVTNLDYQSTNDSAKNLNFKSGLGNNLEIGYKSTLRNDRFVYSFGLDYNEFNAEAYLFNSKYSWETKYIGIVNKISYCLTSGTFNRRFYADINVFFDLGFSTAKMLSGKQFINNYYYDLAEHEDFSGALLRPFVGYNIEYTFSREFKFNFGFNFSKTFSLSNETSEKTSFNTSQFQLGVQVSLLR